ncbi:MAG TPA: winged helix DNA-binding domain-containing protein [Acidimicrobiia bacterium]|nr:winged helix DNA-binding domain-containing protein [Acidimicrobiia bacterium]
MTVLTTGQLNRALLARQMLLSRSTAAIPRVLERMAGLQAQYAPAIYVGLWSRMAGLHRPQVTRALERRLIVQGTMMRSTIHVVSASDYWPLMVATDEARRQWFARVYRGPYSEEDFAAASETVRDLLGSGPQPRSVLVDAIGNDLWAGIHLDMVRVPPSGTWERRRADLYGLAEHWIPRPAIAMDAALEVLIRRYLGGFGPAVATDIGTWAGMHVDRILPTLERMDLRHFHAEDGKVLVDIKRMPLPDADVAAPVRFLPVWDAALLVHARRKAVLGEEHRPIIFSTKTPQSMPTFLVDGAVAGTWKYEASRVKLTPFDVIRRKWKRDLEEEAKALAAFHA